MSDSEDDFEDVISPLSMALNHILRNMHQNTVPNLIQQHLQAHIQVQEDNTKYFNEQIQQVVDMYKPILDEYKPVRITTMTTDIKVSEAINVEKFKDLYHLAPPEGDNIKFFFASETNATPPHCLNELYHVVDEDTKKTKLKKFKTEKSVTSWNANQRPMCSYNERTSSFFKRKNNIVELSNPKKMLGLKILIPNTTHKVSLNIHQSGSFHVTGALSIIETLHAFLTAMELVMYYGCIAKSVEVKAVRTSLVLGVLNFPFQIKLVKMKKILEEEFNWNIRYNQNPSNNAICINMEKKINPRSVFEGRDTHLPSKHTLTNIKDFEDRTEGHVMERKQHIRHVNGEMKHMTAPIKVHSSSILVHVGQNNMTLMSFYFTTILHVIGGHFKELLYRNDLKGKVRKHNNLDTLHMNGYSLRYWIQMHGRLPRKTRCYGVWKKQNFILNRVRNKFLR